MKVLLVGGGAREHALAWKLSQESCVDDIVCGPGNAGIAAVCRCLPLDMTSPGEILELAKKEKSDFTVVGPEVPLANGVADVFKTAGHPLFGPSRSAAKLESSKVFAKEFMARHKIPTARFQVCDAEDEALIAVSGNDFGFPVVVKADGLAAGKGVTVAGNRGEAEEAVREAMSELRFGSAGKRLIIEECLTGVEVSFFVLCDGVRGLTLPSAQDHKRIFNDDKGPNTGGMGAFAPSPLMSIALQKQVMSKIVQPTLNGLRKEGHEFRGVLYVGLMLTGIGPQVIEFNVRFGDPEAQVVLPMIETELAPVLYAAATGSLENVEWKVSRTPHVGVVLASGGYPGFYKKNLAIQGLDRAAAISDVVVFHAGSRFLHDSFVTNGGRVLTVVGRGETFNLAREQAYKAAKCIEFEGKHIRTDIGLKALTAVGEDIR
tara:strand:- start:32077 stop:33372 length:1296 start_codon:yes stop_codon:yes gene_type:complete